MTIRELSLQEHSEAFGTFQEPSIIFFEIIRNPNGLFNKVYK